jgi:DNA helicase IV
VSSNDSAHPGSTAVITPQPLPAVPGAVVLSPREAKGLEFDTVLVVERRRMLDGGAADLYVSLTRVTQGLGGLTSRRGAPPPARAAR